MGAALSSACSSLISVVESFCRESYSWLSSLFGMRDALSAFGDCWNHENVVEGYKNGKIRSLVKEEDSPPQALKVTFINESPNEIILCWISSNGDLHHYYRMPPKGGSHMEHTCTGDAFVIFEASTPAAEKPSGNNDEEKALLPKCNDDNVVAAYRPRSIEKSKHHVVTLNKTETMAMAMRGFLRGSVKKQKILQWSISVDPKEPKPEVEDIVDTTNKFYEKTKYGEWTVYCEPGCWDPNSEECKSNDESKQGGPSRHEVFQADLKALSQRLPEHVREVLCESTSLYMNTTHTHAQKVDNAVGCFHPGRDWLLEHKMNPDKCGQVEFYNVTNYSNHRKLWGTGGIILHEFCHAYHNKHLPDGYNNKEIIECYQAAMDEGLYDNCNYHSCYVGLQSDATLSPFGEPQTPVQPDYEIKSTKHYACSNHMEYFAELSVAFLASPEDGDLPQEEYNKWYPHNAKQLKEHDPRAYTLLEKLWGVERQ